MGESSGSDTGEAGSGGAPDAAMARTIGNSGSCVAPQGLVVLAVPLATRGQNQRYAYLFSISDIFRLRENGA